MRVGSTFNVPHSCLCRIADSRPRKLTDTTAAGGGNLDPQLVGKLVV